MDADSLTDINRLNLTERVCPVGDRLELPPTVTGVSTLVQVHFNAFGKVVEAMVEVGRDPLAVLLRVANPVMVVDEVEKAGTATSIKGHTFGLAEGLLPLLEPLTAKRWSCPYYQVRFDMSWVIWVLTSNDFRKLPGPLLSRCPPIRLQELTHAEVVGFARRQGRRRGLSEVSIVAITEVLAHPANRHRQLSLRTVNRMLDRAATLEAGSIQH